MAVFDVNQLQRVRQGLARDVSTVGWTKAQANAAVQAIEDYFETTARAGFGAAIETAVPGVFSNANKKLIGKYWMQDRFGRGG